MASRSFSFIALVGLVSVLGSLSVGCTHVAPYDRARLAHPTMTGGTTGMAAGHVHAVHEGAVGGGSVAEGGCGCN
jgi:hypothetical protein